MMKMMVGLAALVATLRSVTEAKTGDAAMQPTSFVDLGWRFGTNYVPQHYGQWKFRDGSWNFGNDKRIECEACGYVMYMLIDRLGDNFNEAKINRILEGAATNFCDSDVQWVFKSACRHILIEDTDLVKKIKNSIMKLTEPEDICKQINLCAPDFYDSMMAGGAWSSAPGVFPANGMGGGMGGVGFGNGMNYNQLGSPMSVQHPGAGFSNPDGSMSPYPQPGTKPLNSNSPYSPYSFGGYDAYGFPNPSNGVASSTPPPPMTGEGAEAAG